MVGAIEVSLGDVLKLGRWRVDVLLVGVVSDLNDNVRHTMVWGEGVEMQGQVIAGIHVVKSSNEWPVQRE